MRAVFGIDRRAASTPLLVASTIGVYALVLVGATLSLSESLAACQTWPSCGGSWVVPPNDPAAVALAHRMLATLVGGMILGTIAVGWGIASRRTRLALLVVTLLYPLQVGMGAATAIAGGSAIPSALHLATAMLIFGTLVLALAWHLEDRFPTISEDTADERAATITSPQDPTPPHGVRDTVLAYLELTKPRLMWLLCLVAVAGMALAAGPTLDSHTVVATLAGGVLAIGASGTYNHVIERDVDRHMARTADRPMAADEVPVRHAIVFGTVLAVASIVVFLLLVNVVAAALGVAAIVFYSVVYTVILKPNTVQNTVIGGAAGALPALIGWSAITGGIELPGLMLALVIFMWTPAHFYNLALVYKEDYASGDFPMLPVVRGERVTRKHILLYAGLTMLAVAALGTVGSLGLAFATVAVVGGGGFLWMIIRLHSQQTRRAAMRAFHASNAYLGLLLCVVVADALLV